ncbi:MAG TPA: efflux RND transporter periplasmic adaptor subunit [Tepidisphaeraceae bacterium]|nr:efflux RND transporter periplasmic adaptor subunit [Tepidisphaeraceae bacterium]
MLQLRPTFSESWYRVKDLRAKLRPSTQISRQYYRGERWYVVRDPAGNQFHRLSDAAYRFVGLLDGSRTVGEAWELVGGQLADDAPTQPEVIQILSQLHSANLLETDVSADAMVLLRRHKQQLKRKFQGRLMNLLFPRIPIWDPDAFLKRWLPLIGPMMSKGGAIVWFIVVIAACLALAPRWEEVTAAARNSIAPGNWLWLWAVFVGIKFIHECGHAFACRRFGGEVHEMGIMFLVFIPTPYVDASTAWAFPSRWARMFVGAAGMIVELFVAAVMAFVWMNTNPNTLTNQLAYNTMLIASVSTVIFNANPLLRYDGYYMLSDFLEIPNLQRKSTEYITGLVKRHVFRVKATQPLPPVWQRVQLFVYGVLSTIYRIMIGIAIILLVAFTIPVLGMLMAIGGIVTWLVTPIVKLFKYLALDPELHRKRGRAVAFTLAFAALVFLAIGVIPYWENIRATGVLEPEDQAVIHAAVPGFVRTDVPLRARDGDWVKKGDIIIELYDRKLESELKQARIRRDAAVVVMTRAMDENPAQVNAARITIDAEEEKIRDLERQKAELTIKAPIDGQLVAPNLQTLPGRYVQRGEELATVMTLDRLLVKAALEQRDVELAREETHTEIRLAGDVSRALIGEDARVIPGAQSQLPSSIVGHSGGGDIPVDPRDQQGTKPLTPQFELRVKLANPRGEFYPGQRAYVRMTVGTKPLLYQWTRRFLQLIDSSNTNEWL